MNDVVGHAGETLPAWSLPKDEVERISLPMEWPDRVTREAYSHEVSSAGFWPGGAMGGAPMFYSYAYPSPEGFAVAKVEPDAARWDPALGEFVLDYDEVRLALDSTATLLAFLASTYSAAAELAHWDRAALECAIGQRRVPRTVG